MRGPGWFALPSVLQEGIEKQHNCATKQSASHLAAASYHSSRVYLQVQQWMRKGDDMDPEEWDWLRVWNRIEPRMTALPPAPVALLKVVRCSCT